MNRTGGSFVQLAYVVESLDAAIAHWITAFGAGPFFRAEFQPERQTYRGQPSTVRTAVAVTFMDGLMIELIQQIGHEPSVFQEMLAARGAGPHHLLYRSALDFDAEVARFAALKPDAIAYTGELAGIARIAYVDMVAEMGCFIELSERASGITQAFAQMVAACRDWDGTSDPVRPFPPLR